MGALFKEPRRGDRNGAFILSPLQGSFRSAFVSQGLSRLPAPSRQAGTTQGKPAGRRPGLTSFAPAGLVKESLFLIVGSDSRSGQVLYLQRPRRAPCTCKVW